MSSNDLLEFRQLLDEFVFFHLGADAVVGMRREGRCTLVTISHARVHTFQWRLDATELSRLVADRRLFEEAMLDQLTAHRRS